jgi:hypothetical protein
MLTMSDQLIEQYRNNLKVKPRTFSITADDFDTVKWISAHHRCSNSEAVRTAIRFYAARLVELDLQKKAERI